MDCMEIHAARLQELSANLDALKKELQQIRRGQQTSQQYHAPCLHICGNDGHVTNAEGSTGRVPPRSHDYDTAPQVPFHSPSTVRYLPRRAGLDGEMDLELATVNALYDSYMRSFHAMHPVLHTSRLRRQFDEFIREDSTRHTPSNEPLDPLDRSPGNCIIYLVLALGQICVQQDHSSRADKEHEAHSKGSKLPGVASYFFRAAEILCEQHDGDDLVHAQMFLLAGMYQGQFGRTKESIEWVGMAGRILLTLLRRHDLYDNDYWSGLQDVSAQHETSQRSIQDTRQNLIVMASWSCLQLESELLGDLELSASGIQQIENILCFPRTFEDENGSFGAREPEV